jgi:hypothetical protein
MKHHENLKFLENMTLKEKARAKVKELDAYVEEMNAKGNLTNEEWGEVWSAMLQTNRYLRAIGAPESEMYDI